MVLKLFAADLSPAVRGTLLTVGALGLEVDIVPVNLMAGEHLSPDYLKKNPLHTVPTLQDGNFCIFDSHAINMYLADKYGKDDSLYPKDLQKRAIVNQRLFFDTGIMFPRVGAVIGAIIRQGAKTVDKDKADAIIQGYNSLETLLEGNDYVAGDDITIADFSIAATISTSNAVVPIAANTFPRISEWLSKIQALPFYAKGNQVGLDKLVAFVRSKLG